MRARQLGMSLVEVMVAVLIGMIGVLIITHVYITSDNFNRSTLGEGGAQTNGLIALYTIERDLRMGGYGIANTDALGCGNIYWYYDPDYSSNVAGGTLPNITLAPVVITTDTTAPFNDPDRITVMYSTSAERAIAASIEDFNPPSSVIEMDGISGFLEGDLILMVNGTGCTLGKITKVLPGPQKLQLNPGVTAPHNPPAWGSFPTTYGSGDQILNLGNPVVRTYSIFSDASNPPRLRATDAMLSAGGTSLDLVEGIVDLKAQYGKDTDGNGSIDVWNVTQPVTGDEWLQVKAVRLAVLSRIGVYEKPTGGACTATTVLPTWEGSADRPFVIPEGLPSCYRYRVFETTVPLRNVIWAA